MFEQILGLPAHPLIVHAAVVLTPLLAVLAVLHALVPGWRAVLAWAVVLLAVAAPATVLVARQSGIALKEARFGSASGILAGRIAEHESFGLPLLLWTIGLGAVSLVLVFAVRSDRFSRPAGVALSGLTVVLAAVVLFYVVRAGHTGATAVWGS